MCDAKCGSFFLPDAPSPARIPSRRTFTRPLCLRAFVRERRFIRRKEPFETASQKALIREEPFVRRHGESVPRSQTQSHVRSIYREGVRHFVPFRAVPAVRVPARYVRAPGRYVRVLPRYVRVVPMYARPSAMYERMPPTYARHPARYERVPPTYSRQPGKYERTPPTLERGPPMVKRGAPRRLRKVGSPDKSGSNLRRVGQGPLCKATRPVRFGVCSACRVAIPNGRDGILSQA